MHRRLALLVSISIVVALGVTTRGSAIASPDAPRARLETNISHNGSASYVGANGKTTMGEPEIAENPRDPANLFVDWNSFRYPTTDITPIPNSCGGRTSSDAGITWQPALVPMSSCADAVAAFGPDGTLYAGGIVVTHTDFFPAPCTNHPGGIIFVGLCIVVTAYDGIVHSNDSGQTWSPVARPMGSQSEGPFPFAHESGNPAATFDRPWVKVDQSTNTCMNPARTLPIISGSSPLRPTTARRSARSMQWIHPTIPRVACPAARSRQPTVCWLSPTRPPQRPARPVRV